MATQGTISSVLLKVMISIILLRLDDWYIHQVTNNQCGFIKYKGTQDAVLTVKRVQQVRSKMGGKTWLSFVDLSSAFDTINRRTLWIILKKRLPPGVTSLNLDLLENLYSQTTAYIKSDPDETEFTTGAGVRQGGCESPLLYNLYMDWVLRIFEEKQLELGMHGILLDYDIPTAATSRAERSDHPNRGSMSLSHVAFADDLTTFHESLLHLESSLHLFQSILTAYGLRMNIPKTETMLFSETMDDYPASLVTLEKVNLKNSETFKYLGSHIKYDQTGTGEFEVAKRIESANQKFAEMKQVLCNYKIVMPVRMLFYTSFVRSRLCYNAQSWTLNKALLDKLEAAHHGFLRRLVKGGFRCKKTPNIDKKEKAKMSKAELKAYYDENDIDFAYVLNNDKIRQVTNAKPLSEFIHKQQHKFTSHIIRLPNHCPTKQLLFNSNKGKKRVNGMIEQVLKTSGIEINQYCRNARNVF